MDSVAGSVNCTGSISAENIIKLANKIIVVLNIAAMSEVLVLAAKTGAEQEPVYQVTRDGLAGSTLAE